MQAILGSKGGREEEKEEENNVTGHPHMNGILQCCYSKAHKFIVSILVLVIKRFWRFCFFFVCLQNGQNFPSDHGL